MISTTTDRVTFAGNGVTLAFSFPYKFFANADMVVLLKVISTGVETVQVITTNYTVTGATLDAGGTITFVAAPTALQTVIIYRDKSAIQELDLVDNGKIPSDSLETQLDKLAMMIQRNKNLLGRTVRLPEGFIASFSTILPGLMTNDGILKTTSTGAGIEYISLATLTNTILLGSQLFTVSRVLVSSAAGAATSSATTAAEIAFISGLTSAVQAQLDTKQLRSVLTTKGDLYIATASDTVVRQAVGATDQVLTADAAQTNGMAYNTLVDADLIHNLSIANSVASNALTISLKTAAGADASSTDPIKVAFRNATLTTGTVSLVKVTAALSGVVASGATLGHTNAIENYIYVGALNNAGTLEPCWSTRPWDENALITTVSASAGSTSATAIYSTTGRTNVASRIVCKLVSTQTTAGTWAVVPTNISVGSAPKVLAYLPPTVQTFTSGSGTYTLPTSPRKPLYINVKLVGAGGGGGGGGTASQTAGGAGGNTTFGTALLTTNGGGGGREGNTGGSQPSGGAGGTATLNSPALGAALTGGGGAGGENMIVAQYAHGGSGAASVFGGQGLGTATGVGGAGVTTTGGGGAGGGTTTGPAQSGAGGGSGAYIDAIISASNIASTQAYAIGAAGTAGGAGTSGNAGGAGGSGYIIVTEYYQ